MNITRLSIMLCLALQVSDGPYLVLINFDGGQEEALVTKEELQVLSNQEFVLSIETSRRLDDRRWRDRKERERRL